MQLLQFEPNKGIPNEPQSRLDDEEDLNYRWEGLWTGQPGNDQFSHTSRIYREMGS